METIFNRRGSQGDDDGQTKNDGRMAERKKEADRDRPLALLHQLARHVVNGRDMIGVHRVAESEGVGQERRAQQNRMVMKGQQRPEPGPGVEADEQGIEEDNPASQAGPGRAGRRRGSGPAAQEFKNAHKWPVPHDRSALFYIS